LKRKTKAKYPEKAVWRLPQTKKGSLATAAEQGNLRAARNARPAFCAMTIFQLDQATRRIARQQITDGRMSVKLLAAKTGKNPAHVSNYLAGRRNVSVKALSAFLAALGLCAEIVPIQATRIAQDAPPPKP
jgi:hypothetical protein